MFLTVADTLALEDSLYTYQVYAVDKDSALFGDSVRYRLEIKPIWLCIDSISGLISGTPSMYAIHDTLLIIDAYDNAGGSCTQIVNLRIARVNHQPIFVNIADTLTMEDSLYQYTPQFYDQDVHTKDDSVSLIVIRPSWLMFDSTGRKLLGIPHWNNVGDTIVILHVTDKVNAYAEQSWKLTVRPVYHEPSSVHLNLPHNKDTVQIWQPMKPIIFSWSKSIDLDSEDTLHYTLNIWSKLLDTSITTTDTLSEVNFGKFLKVSTLHQWTVMTSDGRHSVIAADTFFFTTSSKITSVNDGEYVCPKVYQLSQNYPNPFNPSTIIRFALPKQSRVRLRVFDILGREMASLVDAVQDVGFYEKTWNASGLSSGIYFYRIEAVSIENITSRFVETKKMLLLR
jgi:hypothetical protein